MKLIKAGVLLAALSMALAGCEEGAASSSTGSKPSSSTGSSTGSMSSAAVTKLATQGNLSPDAIRLQTMSVQLLTLEQEQQAAKDRSASFAAQGTGLGIAGGAIAGLLACQLAGCSTAQPAVRIAGARIRPTFQNFLCISLFAPGRGVTGQNCGSTWTAPHSFSESRSLPWTGPSGCRSGVVRPSWSRRSCP